MPPAHHGRAAGALLRGLLALLASGCTPPETSAISAFPGQPPVGSAAAPPRINSIVGTPTAAGVPQIAYGRPAEPPSPPGPAPQQGGDISLDFAGTDIREVAAQILGTILRENYTIDPAVQGTATLRTVQPLARSQLLPTLQALLAQNGAALVRSGTLYRIVPAAQAPATAASEGVGGTTVVMLRHAAAEELARVLQPYVTEGSRIIADPARNALLVGGDPQARESLLSLVRSFDIDLLAGQSYALLPVGVGDVRDVTTALQEALRAAVGGAGGQVRVVPMARVNAVLVVAQQPRAIDEARRIHALIDRTRQQTIRSWHVHYLQNSTANDVAYLLQQAFTPNNVTAQPTRALRGATGAGAASGPGEAAGGGGVTAITGRPAMGGTGFGRGFGTGGTSGGSGLGAAGLANATPGGGSTAGSTPILLGQGQPPAGPAAPANPLLGPLDPSGVEANPDSLRIIPDPQNNALLFYGTRREVGTVEAMLRKIDILPLQVRIDAVIAEVTLNDALQYGTQFFFRSGGLNGVLSAAQGGFNPAQIAFNTTLPGFILSGTRATGVPMAITALQDVTTVNVLSSPQLMVVDNHTARLQVGDVVPYLSQTSQSVITPNAPVVSSINYQQTGVIIEITPRVNSGGLVTLDVMQNVSDVARGITTQGINSPTFQERSVVSRVVVQDGQTVGLAGLIRDNVNVGNQGIPWLKDVPLLGALAGQQSNTRQRTELLIMITPRVMRDQREARALTEDLREQLINAAAVPDRLDNLPTSGSPDPNARLRRRIGLPN
ncbi:type II secretion system secretin GspD [Siccirubricoccus deserti]|uniref:type II secretion system secretin GspD n=1 Tax=Siccirubricoccus deserti TaxID=2013562 RepID=UPI001E420C9A|nr:type II secretion system secretin GspD [Siccirubricoccus deserti]